MSIRITMSIRISTALLVLAGLGAGQASLASAAGVGPPGGFAGGSAGGGAPARPADEPRIDRKAEQERFERDLRAAFEEHIADLLAHAAWCQAQQLLATRAKLLRAVLELDPDQAEARRELGYRRERDGTWLEPRSPRAPKDRNPQAEAEQADRRREVDRALGARVLALIERCADAIDPGRLRAAVDRALAVVPDDPALRGRLGETRIDEGWVLLETERARRARSELRPLVRRLLAEAEATPRAVELAPRELAFGAPFVGAWRTPVLRVVATTDEAEALRVAAALTAALPLVNTLLKSEARYHAQATVFLFGTPQQGRAWLESHPALDASRRAFISQLEFTNIAETGDSAAWADDVRRRVDGLVRLALAWLLHDGFGLTMEHGMLSEGIGLYLTRELIGTRLSWFVTPAKYARQDAGLRLRNMLLDPATNWMNEAHKLFAEPQCPKLQVLLVKHVNQMSTEDLLVAYVAAAYLLEAWLEQVPRLLREVAAGRPPHEVLEELLGYDVVELDARMRRWLGERR